jgi:hypothetical protein
MKPAQLATAFVVLAALVAGGACTDEKPPAAPPTSAEPARAAAGPRFDVRIVAKATGKPVAGAVVVVFEDDKPPRDATTDADGVARFPVALTAADARVRVRAAGFETTDAFADDESMVDGRPFEVALELGVSVEGVVLESDGRPLAGARVVHFRGGEDEDCFAHGYPPLAEATSAADGVFRLDGLRAGRKSALNVTAARHVAKSATRDPAAHGRLEVRLDPGGRITGVVRDPSGAAVADASVGACPAESTDAPEGTPILDGTTTDAAGRFAIDGVPLIGAWTISASKEGFADSLRVEAVIDAAHMEAACEPALRAVARVEVLVLGPTGAPVNAGRVSYEADFSYGAAEIEAGGRCEFDVSRPGRIVLHVDAPIAPPYEERFECSSGQTTKCTLRLQDGVTVAGRVVDDVGAPVAGASIEVQGHEKGSGAFFKRVGAAGADGSFRVAGLFPAAYDLVVETPRHERTKVKETTVPGDDVRVVLRRKGRVTMRLRPPADFRPPKRAWIYAENRESHVRENEQFDWADGAVEMWLAPGKWSVRIELSGLADVKRDVDVAAAAETPLGDVDVVR